MVKSNWQQQAVAALLVFSTVFSAVGVASVGVSTPPEAEPNDSQSNANQITTGTTITGEVAGSEDVDWFAFTVEAGQTINVTATVEGVPMKMRVVGPDGNNVAQTRGNYTTIRTGTTAARSGTYYVRVFKWFGDGGGTYSFEVQTVETTDREPNEARTNATRISTGETISDEIPIGDVDWYGVDVTAGQTINLSAQVSGSAGLEFTIVNPSGERVRSTGGSNTEFVSGTTATQTGTYYINVQKNAGSVGATYSFTTRTYGTTDNEPNEARANATQLSLNASVEDTLSQGDIDWYALQLETGDSITVSGSVTGAGGLDFRLLYQNGTTVGSDGNVGSGQYGFNATAPYTGVYYIKVAQSSSPGPDYTMNVRTNGTTGDEQQRTGSPEGDEQARGTADGEGNGSGSGLPLLLIALVVGLVVVLLVVFLWRRRDEA